VTSLTFDIFARDVNASKEFDKLSRSLKNSVRDFDDFGTRAATSLAKTANSLANLSTGIAAIESVGSAVGNLSGVLGLLPGAAADAGAAFATLKVGTAGFADGLKEFADTSKIQKAAGGVADAAVAATRRIEAAEKTLASAQRSAQDAQDNLRRAREHAADQLQELALAERGASLSVEDATIGLERAKERLAAAQQQGATGLDLQEAQLGVKQAALAVDEAKHNYADLAKEAEHANKVGVEGSDEVVAAKRQEADAAQAVKDAQEEVARAHEDAARAADKASTALGGTTAKFEALSANAKETVAAIFSLKDSWTDLQHSVADALFAGVGQEIKDLGATYMPVLKTGMSEVAGEFNKGAHSLGDFLAQGEQVNSVKTIFASTRDVAGTFSLALRPLVQILLDIASVGSGMLPGLTSGFANAAENAALFVRNAKDTGQLQGWIQKGLDTLKKLGELLGNIGSIVATVFKGLSLGGKDFLGTMLKVTGQIKTFLQSFEGQQALKALGTALQTVSSVVTDVFLEALKQLAPIIVKLAPGFAELAKIVGGALVTALQILGPILQGIATFLSANVGWLGPLAVATLVLVEALKVAIIVWRALQIALAISPFGAIILAVAGLAVLIIENWDHIKAALAAAWEWIKNVAAAAWEGIKEYIVAPIVEAAKWIGDKVGAIVQFFIDLPGRVWSGLKDFAAGVKHVILDPIIDVVRWVGEQIGNLIQFFIDVPGRIGRALANLGGIIVDVLKAALNAVINALNWALDHSINWVIRTSNDIMKSVPGFSGGGLPTIPHIPTLHTGGMVPGRPGQESLWVLEAGERVIPAGGGGSAQNIMVEVTVNPGSDHAAGNFISELFRRQLASVTAVAVR
jgi:hypothetical protein